VPKFPHQAPTGAQPIPETQGATRPGPGVYAMGPPTVSTAISDPETPGPYYEAPDPDEAAPDYGAPPVHMEGDEMEGDGSVVWKPTYAALRDAYLDQAYAMAPRGVSGGGVEIDAGEFDPLGQGQQGNGGEVVVDDVGSGVFFDGGDVGTGANGAGMPSWVFPAAAVGAAGVVAYLIMRG